MPNPPAKVLKFPTAPKRPAPTEIGTALPAGEVPQGLDDPLNLPEDYDPCCTGPAHCMQCKHTWTAVAPVGEPWLTCPACGSGKGMLTYPAYPPEVDVMWVCECDNTLFMLTERGWLCPNCGTYCRF